MPSFVNVINKIDSIVAVYDTLQKKYGFPRNGAIFDCLKAAQKPDGSIPYQLEKHIEEKLHYPIARQRRVRSFYDMLSKDIAGGASGKASETLFHRFLHTDDKDLKIRITGQLLEYAGLDSLSITDYKKHGGYLAAQRALQLKSEQIIDELEKSGIQGRGGAYFPTAVKLKDAFLTKASHKFLVCNADEGEPPTYKDKMLMDFKPHLLIEGMIITGKAVGAHLGIIYIRGDYYETIKRLNNAIDEAKNHNLLGDNITGSDFSFDIIIFAGSGSYVAGCSGAIVESIEGKAAIPRSKQFHLTQDGINHMPTVIDNVETLCNIPLIIQNGGEAFAKIGSPLCPGTKLFSLCGDVAIPGIYELPTGITMRQLIEQYGGGVVEKNGNSVTKGVLKAVSPGGATTALLSASEINIPLDSISLRDIKSSLGSGAVTVFNTTRNLREFARQVLEFLSEESCGKCMQCPLIISRTLQTLAVIEQKIINGEVSSDETQKIISSRNDPKPLNCELGKGSLTVIVSAIAKFPQDFAINNADYEN